MGRDRAGITIRNTHGGGEVSAIEETLNWLLPACFVETGFNCPIGHLKPWSRQLARFQRQGGLNGPIGPVSQGMPGHHHPGFPAASTCLQASVDCLPKGMVLHGHPEGPRAHVSNVEGHDSSPTGNLSSSSWSSCNSASHQSTKQTRYAVGSQFLMMSDGRNTPPQGATHGSRVSSRFSSNQR